MVRTSTKLAVTLKPDVVVDVDAVFNCLQESYRVNYCGLYKVQSGLCLYVQTMPKHTPMYSPKVFRLCVPFGATALPKPFSTRSGICVNDKGHFVAGRSSPGTIISRMAELNLLKDMLEENKLRHEVNKHQRNGSKASKRQIDNFRKWCAVLFDD